VIVQTPAGFASPLAEAIDRAQLADVAGTIAGENTIFIAAREGITGAELAAQLSHQLEGAT
jgi:transcriptional regulator of arginine metabolism